MHLALGRNENLEATVPYFKKFSDLLEDAYMMLAKVEVSKLGEEHLAVLRRLREFHYHTAWKVPALIISEKTATGPGENDLKGTAAQKLDDLIQRYDREIVDLESYCAERGLLPDYTDYPDRDDTEMQALVDELADRYIRG
jgi:sulfur relay (sulfurtransferase) DsrC/TusE family protein